MYAYTITQFLFVKNNNCLEKQGEQHQNVSNENSTTSENQFNVQHQKASRRKI